MNMAFIDLFQLPIKTDAVHCLEKAIKNKWIEIERGIRGREGEENRKKEKQWQFISKKATTPIVRAEIHRNVERNQINELCEQESARA